MTMNDQCNSFDNENERPLEYSELTIYSENRLYDGFRLYGYFVYMG